jgi:hypothetical protein
MTPTTDPDEGVLRHLTPEMLDEAAKEFSPHVARLAREILEGAQQRVVAERRAARTARQMELIEALIGLAVLVGGLAIFGHPLLALLVGGGGLWLVIVGHRAGY